MPHPNAEQTPLMPIGAEAAPLGNDGPSLARRALIMVDGALAAQAHLLHPPAPAPKEAGMLKDASESAPLLKWHVPSLDAGSTIMSHVTRAAVGTPEDTPTIGTVDGTTTPADGTVTPADGTTPVDSGVLPQVGVSRWRWRCTAWRSRA